MAFDVDAHAGRIERDGYTVIADFLAPEVLTEVRRVLAFYLGNHRGRNDFEGEATERVYTLVARGRVFWDLALDPRVLALCERFLLPNFLLTASQAIQIYPGESAQAFHSDDAFYHLPRPRRMVSLSTICAIDDFTAENGGTEVIVGSHLWSDDEMAGSYDQGVDHGDEFTRDEARRALRSTPVVMPAGACIVFSGMVLHRGGANRSRRPRCAVSQQYCQPWARQQENFTLSVPVEVARAMPSRLQELLGYSIHPPFIGQLTASHPAKALAPDYRNRVAAQAEAAAARLPE